MALNRDTVRRILQENPTHIHYIFELSEYVGKSPEAVRKDFKRSGEQQPLGEFISHTRLELLAQALLANPELRCNEVCRLLGFDRLDSAAHAFKDFFGETMREYRRQRLPRD